MVLSDKSREQYFNEIKDCEKEFEHVTAQLISINALFQNPFDITEKDFITAYQSLRQLERSLGLMSENIVNTVTEVLEKSRKELGV